MKSLRCLLVAIGFLSLCAIAAPAADVTLTPDGKVPGTPFQALQSQIDSLKVAIETMLVGKKCPNGQFLRGFNLDGSIICETTSEMPMDPPSAFTILNKQSIIDSINNYLIGNDDITIPFSFVSSGLEGHGTFLGYAFCDPNDLSKPSFYEYPFNCEPDVQIEIGTVDGHSISINIFVPALYIDFEVQVNTLGMSTSGDGFLMFNNLKIIAEASLLDPLTDQYSVSPIGNKKIGAISIKSIEQENIIHELILSNTFLNYLSSEIIEYLKIYSKFYMMQVVHQLVNEINFGNVYIVYE